MPLVFKKFRFRTYDEKGNFETNLRSFRETQPQQKFSFFGQKIDLVNVPLILLCSHSTCLGQQVFRGSWLQHFAFGYSVSLWIFGVLPRSEDDQGAVEADAPKKSPQCSSKVLCFHKLFSCWCLPGKFTPMSSQARSTCSTSSLLTWKLLGPLKPCHSRDWHFSRSKFY